MRSTALMENIQSKGFPFMSELDSSSCSQAQNIRETSKADSLSNTPMSNNSKPNWVPPPIKTSEGELNTLRGQYHAGRHDTDSIASENDLHFMSLGSLPASNATAPGGLLPYRAATSAVRPFCNSRVQTGIPLSRSIVLYKPSSTTSFSRSAWTMPATNFSQYAFDTARVLKDIMRYRHENVVLRVMPKEHLFKQHLLQEADMRAQTVLQEQNARMVVEHRRAEEKAKKLEQDLARRNKANQEELKRQQMEEIKEQKNTVASILAEKTQELRQRLGLLERLQPWMNVTNTAMALVKDEQSDIAILAELLEEDKKLQKGLKADARFNKTKTAAVDGGALPYWFKHCLVSSFNVAAILKRAPYRAAVQDAFSLSNKQLGDKKILVIFTRASDESKPSGEEGGEVVSWAHARVALPDVVAAGETFLALSSIPNSESVNHYQGIVWPKEDVVNIVRTAKAPNSTIAPLGSLSKSTLSYDKVTSAELSVKDVKFIGDAASM